MYIPDSLKESTREKRGHGVRKEVSGHTKLPHNWTDFLRDSINKMELFAFLSTKVVEFNWPPAKAVYVTTGTAVIPSSGWMSTLTHSRSWKDLPSFYMTKP